MLVKIKRNLPKPTGAFTRLFLCFLLCAMLSSEAFAQNAPVAVADSFTVGRGGTLSIAAPGVLANDSDPDGNAISVLSIFTMPANGTLTFGANGSFTYTHNGGVSAIDSFVYVLADTEPATPNVNVTAILTIVPADFVAPTVTSVSVPAAGNYLAGQNLDFTVGFGENVYVDTTGGTPSIPVTLDTGGTVQASYMSGSGSTSLVFRMPVIAGQQDLNGVALGATIAFNGSTIRDLAANNALPALNGVPSTASVLVAAPVGPVGPAAVPGLGTLATGLLALFIAAGSTLVSRRM